MVVSKDIDVLNIFDPTAEMENIFEKAEKTHKDKSDRATRDKVLDRKTLAILEKLKKRAILCDLEGCISSGKEANIYRGKLRHIPKCKFFKKSKITMDNAFGDNMTSNANDYSTDSYKVVEKHYGREAVGNQLDSAAHIDNDIVTHLANTARTDDDEKHGDAQVEKSKQNIVVKIFRTSILEFKNRNIYITNELRFQNFKITNPRKLIKVWAEKEVRNLVRLNNQNIASPRPLYLKKNIIIMTLIGDDDHVAARLKDLKYADFSKLYNETVEIIIRMYRCAKLIHCDLSEYNLLYHNNQIYVIDVGQSVDITHTYADFFLANDIANINKFFGKKKVCVADVESIYTKVTGKKIYFDVENYKIDRIGHESDDLPDIHVLPDNTMQLTGDAKTDNMSKEKNNNIRDNTGQFVKNKCLTKEEKLERRKCFKIERKIKRMSRDKTKVKKECKKNVKRKKHAYKRYG